MKSLSFHFVICGSNRHSERSSHEAKVVQRAVVALICDAHGNGVCQTRREQPSKKKKKKKGEKKEKGNDSSNLCLKGGTWVAAKARSFTLATLDEEGTLNTRSPSHVPRTNVTLKTHCGAATAREASEAAAHISGKDSRIN